MSREKIENGEARLRVGKTRIRFGKARFYQGKKEGKKRELSGGRGDNTETTLVVRRGILDSLPKRRENAGAFTSVVAARFAAADAPLLEELADGAWRGLDAEAVGDALDLGKETANLPFVRARLRLRVPRDLLLLVLLLLDLVLLLLLLELPLLLLLVLRKLRLRLLPVMLRRVRRRGTRGQLGRRKPLRGLRESIAGRRGRGLHFLTLENRGDRRRDLQRQLEEARMDMGDRGAGVVELNQHLAVVRAQDWRIVRSVEPMLDTCLPFVEVGDGDRNERERMGRLCNRCADSLKRGHKVRQNRRERHAALGRSGDRICRQRDNHLAV